MTTSFTRANSIMFAERCQWTHQWITSSMFGSSFPYCVSGNDDKGTDVSFNGCDLGFRPQQGGGISDAFT